MQPKFPMADTVTPKRRSEIMARIKSKNTTPERIVRTIVRKMRLRFTSHSRTLSGKPDLVFNRRHKVIFVHGCFWHQHRGCSDGRVPRSNGAYWKKKLARNLERDRENQASLRRGGWKSLVIWECETLNREMLERSIRTFLS